MTEVSIQLEQVNKAVQDREGKYLTFALGAEEYRNAGIVKMWLSSNKVGSFFEGFLATPLILSL